MKRIPFVITVFVISLFFITSCSKDAGQGGNSTIWGKVYVRDYNSTFTVLQSEYYGPEIDVYIIYGDDISYGDRTRTNYDGTYEFKYLRPGKYHIYAYSKDSTLQTTSTLPVIKDVEITKRKQTVEVPEITILN